MGKEAKITIHPSFTIGEISERLFSTFLEPIGTMVNGTMYNPKHPTADDLGFRTDFINGLKDTGMPACRLPGGNFVSGWNWKDSIGPKDQRKVHLDPAWYQYITNEVGHDEYLQWAERVGTESMYTINLGTGTMQDAMDIVEYTNHKGGTWWSDLRRKNGHEEPYGVKTWFLGNEMDGPWQLGSWEKDPRGYGVFSNEVSKLIKWIDPTIETAVCGSSAPFMAHFPDWDEEVLTQCYESVDYLSIHHYHSAPPGDLKALLGGALYYEDFINTEVALCDLIAAKCRTPKKVMISFDEYGAMVRPNAELNPGYGPHSMYRAHYRFNPERQYILHDPDNMKHFSFPGGDMIHALSMASIQLAFLRHADRVKIGCMTGGLGALCASDHDHVWKSASYYVFSQLLKYARGTSMQVDVNSDTYDIPGYAIDDNSQYPTKEGVPYIDAACAWSKEDRSLNLFIINRSEEDEYNIKIDAQAFTGYNFVEHVELHSDDFDAKNTYEAPETIIPKVVAHTDENGTIRHTETTPISKIGNTEVVGVSTVFRNGLLDISVKPLSWNLIRFERESDELTFEDLLKGNHNEVV
ncbi:MAG: alpha-L-arabinofuranosidase [Lachnospiraceae bacterium]|nr:alpha-L-arabinofuranosidase [Lachnospiraceae bacterium]